MARNLAWVFSRTVSLSVRMVPVRPTLCGMMLNASPARTMQVETTTASSGSMVREAIVCSAMMVCAATTTGSMPSCGRAACEPLPVISIVNLSHAASIGPAQIANLPSS